MDGLLVVLVSPTGSAHPVAKRPTYSPRPSPAESGIACPVAFAGKQEQGEEGTDRSRQGGKRRPGGRRACCMEPHGAARDGLIVPRRELMSIRSLAGLVAEAAIVT